ncbi:MAG: PQQ-dependent dehydrogenase, methanol/ethanol family [Bryobacteraceae bacterium]|nr:PQQ-dependent dehydrogenase, methanol/ethanol family [Bryobacteraceae bacterium]
MHFILLLLCLTASAQVRYEEILKGPAADWLTYAGSYQGWRYSPLKQITVENAKSLAPKWVYHVPNARGLESSPIVYKGVMYVTNSNSVYALDARSGRLIWQYVDTRPAKRGVNRGAAISGDRVYFTTSDNYLTALDRETGAAYFSRKFADEKQGTSSTSAPLVVKDMVIVGSAGGDSGMRGFLAALSATTGEELWRTYTVPAKGEPGSESWGGLIEYGGGATWLSGTFDPETDTLYWTTGNPWPDFSGATRPGDNLYTCSLLALDLRTGKKKWHFQFTPHDTHDWDAQSWPVLVDIPWQGSTRKVVLHANRNGFFYVLDRVTGEFLRATQLIDKVTWATGIDAKGRPILAPDKDPTPKGNWVCPSVKGATNWMGQSYNPGTGLLYLITLEQCGMYTSSSQQPVPMKNFSGGGATEEGGQVILRALDPKTGKRVWEYPMTGAGRMWAGTVSTAGGVVFTGDDDGHMVALNARTGEHLWHFSVGENLTASPITYEVDGRQYVAIASATAVFSFGLFEPAQSVPMPKVTVRP